MLQANPRRRPRVALSPRAKRLIWIVAVLDMMAVAWMIAAGDELDDPSTFRAVVTLGGRPALVLGLALGAFLLLTALAVVTDGFSSATRLHLGLAIAACAVSVVALAGALSVFLLLVTGALVLGFVARPLRRRR
jgi:O-antigen ligase